jgi:hypothetical protein
MQLRESGIEHHGPCARCLQSPAAATYDMRNPSQMQKHQRLKGRKVLIGAANSFSRFEQFDCTRCLNRESINKILQNGGVRTCPLPTSFGSRRSSALPQGLMITALYDI